jgi:hypothetical protein
MSWLFKIELILLDDKSVRPDDAPAAARLYRVLNEKKTKSQFRNELAFLFSLLFWQID